MKPYYIAFILLLLSKTILCQETDSDRKQNDFGFNIVSVGDQYVIKDSLKNLAIKDTFDFITLGENSWGRKRNSFIGKKGKQQYLIAPDCRTTLSFDSIRVARNGVYICDKENSFSLISDDLEILHDDLAFLEPLDRFFGEFLFKKNDKCGILYKDEVILELAFDSLIDIYSRKYIGIVSNGKMGIFDYDKEKILLKPKYDYIFESHIHSDDEKQRFLIFNDGKFNLINKHGRVLTKYNFDCVTTWVEYGPDGHYICKDAKIGIIDYNGKEVIPPIYDELFYCTSDIYKAVKDEKFGILSSKKKLLVPFEYDSIIVDDFRVTTADKEMFIYAFKNKTWKKINYLGQVVNDNCNECEFIKNLAPFQINHFGFEYVRGLMISKDDMTKE